jgi:drug/metabolite transporter (DMT)-like permease
MTGARRGAAFGLLAAVTFGVSAPLAKLLGARIHPLMLAGLLYAGAGSALAIIGVIVRIAGTGALGRAPRREAPLGRGDVGGLIAVTILGGMVGPLLMLFGLQRCSATAGALLLNLEGPLTALVAVAAFGENLGRRGLGATVLVFAGAALLGAGGHLGQVSLAGATALAGACLAWAVDNNLTQRLALHDPIAVVRAKTLGAGTVLLTLALALGNRVPPLALAAGAVALGAVSYGASVLLDAYALRLLGAAREAAFFATAPFVGALFGAALFREPVTISELGAGALMIAGVAALIRERHAHPHTHAPIEHAHAHTHDAHHQHWHDRATDEPHTHLHRHDPITHDHPHASDAHHRHRH